MTGAALAERLAARWRAHVAGLDAAKAEAHFQAVLAAYGEPHRAYHTLAHLEFLFARLDAHAQDAREPLRLAFAAWYHDIVYDPLATDNEERSARLAATDLTAIGLDADLTVRIASLIRATAAHQSGGDDDDDALFLDADFAILGAAPADYAAYVAGVRREYGAFDDAAWRAGRSAFLANALGRPRVFLTDRFETADGGQARRNMAGELSSLQGAP